jgi:hypothetical protein
MMARCACSDLTGLAHLPGVDAMERPPTAWEETAGGDFARWHHAAQRAFHRRAGGR